MSSITYVAFLRGINVGGNALIKMTELKKAFESLGFKNVVPVVASGNVVFETKQSDPAVLKGQIEMALSKRFKIQAQVILRDASQILNLTKSNPFRNARLSPQTKLQVTFLVEEAKAGAKFPIRLPIKEFQIVQTSGSEICSAVDLSTNARTPELMKLLEKQFGKNITTRTWNTIEKIAKLLGPDSTAGRRPAGT
jgi:uncharacterized protein (DUF1697 family)